MRKPTTLALLAFSATAPMSTWASAGLPAQGPATQGQAAQQPGGTQRTAGSASLRDLTLSEVSPGPQLSYIEVFNGSGHAINLDGYTLETSTGTFALNGLPQVLHPLDYFVLLQGHPSEAGISDDPEVPCILVGEPTCGAVTDTVLLRGPSGAVIDAVAYGVTVDSSGRYGEAVAANQFSPGSFVDVAGEYEQLVIGRNRDNLDTNQTGDWQAGGGANALVGSPFAANDALPEGEDLWIEAFQGYLSMAVSQEYYGFGVSTGSYSNFAGNAASSSAQHSMTVEGPLFGAGEVVLTGSIDNRLTFLGGGRYATECGGKLTDANSVNAIEFHVRREVGGARDVTQIDTTVQVGAAGYPYTLEIVREFDGLRGDYTETITRTLVMWSGTPKVTSGAQTVLWSLGANGSIDRIDCSGSFARPFPLSDGAIGAPPTPQITTESMHLDFHYDRSEGESQVTWSRMEFSYGNGIPTIAGKDMQVRWDAPYGSQLLSRMTGSLDAGSSSWPYECTSSKSLDLNSKLTHWTVVGQVGSASLHASDVTYDPLFGGDSWWDKARKAVRWTAKATGTVAMTGVGLMGCAMTTAGGAALGGGVTLGTLGTATPAGLAVTGGGVLACAGIGRGCGWVIDQIWKE